ncbi:alkaline phosphatase [Desmospora profundinema]|uniref:Alkaline phosphatase n=1 Tax=Desmospora profundinema TaxID=1571184 RepID=A0ABU1IQM2_9BACL|nr:alkaline phosphatase [Desmospora profundinema]MDR6227001.1 alkaline phosphatase [Desmospora profundinema]
MWKKWPNVALVLSLLVSVFSLSLFVNAEAEKFPLAEDPVKNVIFLIPDGFDSSYATNYRWFKGSTPVWDNMLVGMMKTDSNSSKVTDSAAAGTAMATGVKTDNGKISVDPQGQELQTILEASIEAGKSSGLVATSTITHATPAVFASHVASRADEADIAPQLLERVDVLLGGGKKFFLPESKGGKQKERNLIREARRDGYQWVQNKNQLQKADSDKLLGLFADDTMAPELHREETREPSLREMTEKSIQTLNKNEQGFFLMVEGSQIDWAGHAHDAAWAMHDTAAFEQAVKAAVDFAKKDGNTLVVVAGDHETSGMSVGGYGQYAAKPEILRDVTATGERMATKLNKKRSNAKTVLKTYANLDITQKEAQRILDAHDPTDAINAIISEHALIGWSSSVHTGVDVPLYAYGPGSEHFSSLKDNTDLPTLMARAMNIEFAQK